jgi:glyoxylase-like metal-dependent hydrolase (beta-lactamase superfamily II)
MVRLFDGIYAYVHPMGANCNIYAFKDGSDIDLIDTGIKRLGMFRWLWKQMRRDGLEPTNIRNIFHPHVHVDHVQSDRIFQERAVRHRGNVKVYFPQPDAYRFQHDYRVLKSNFDELNGYFQPYPKKFVRGLRVFSTFFGDPFLHYRTPSNLIVYKNCQKLQIGNRIGQVYTTGGHTEGHSFFFFDDEDKILVNSDGWCINEFTSDFGKVLAALNLAKRLDPANLLGGHDPLHLGFEKARQDRMGSQRRLDTMLRPILMQLKPGKEIDLMYPAHRRVGMGFSVRVVQMWALMTVYCIGKTLEKFNIGRMMLSNTGDLRFFVSVDPSVQDIIDFLRISVAEKDRSGCEEVYQQILDFKQI